MVVKRPFDLEEVQELPFKQARHVECCNKLDQFEASIQSNDHADKHDGDHESTFLNFQNHEMFEDNGLPSNSSTPRAFEMNAPLPLVTTSAKDEDFFWAASYSSLPANYFDFPRQNYVAAEDFYPPRKLVPVGPNHQAVLPMWTGRTAKSKLEQANSPNPNYSFSMIGQQGGTTSRIEDGKLVGSCIVQMPDMDWSPVDNVGTGRGRRDCNCLDQGSVRCVQQHIEEAREGLRERLGSEAFIYLGFMEMGEVVACKWSEEEERVFHKVVYSNPVSLGQNFWEHLSQVFVGRSTKEIVSYYFNVFVLRRRAVQNRSPVVDVDSDDDELPGINRTSCNIDGSEEDEDSDVESPLRQYDNQAHQTDYAIAEGNDDEDSDDDDDGSVGGDCATEEDSSVDDVSNTSAVKSCDASGQEAAVKFVKGVEHDEDEQAVNDDSCTSFEFNTDKFVSCGQIGGVRGGNTNFSAGKADECCDGSGQLFLLDSCDTKPWDDRYLSPIKGVDQLPPTCNIIEEIFGRGSNDEQAGNK